MTTILKTEQLTKRFDGLAVVNAVDLEVQEGQVTGVIGPNGAGKTTLFNLISGFIKPDNGHVWFMEKEITGMKPHQIARLGIVRTFQLINIYPNFTVMQNLLLGEHLHARFSPRMFINWPPAEERKEAMEILEYLGLEQLAGEKAINIASGQQKILQFGTALMLHPKIMMLDEPLSGLTQEEIKRFLQIIRNVVSKGITIIMIEHNMRFVMRTCDCITVLGFGKKIVTGSPDIVQNDQGFVDIYLGGDEEAHVT